VLLGHLVLSATARRAAAEIWRHRERTEHEAAALFDRLAADLADAGAPPTLVALSRRCARDETLHAAHCRRIVDHLAPGLPPLSPDRGVRLGPAGSSAADRALYASVALGCVTESLSTALLIEMRAHVPASGVVREGLDRILRDEVRHSRLGWAYLALSASRRDVSWLAGSVSAMLAAALDDERPPAALPDDDRRALLAYGILPPATVHRIADATVRTTIAPGLERHGIHARLAA